MRAIYKDPEHRREKHQPWVKTCPESERTKLPVTRELVHLLWELALPSNVATTNAYSRAIQSCPENLVERSLGVWCRALLDWGDGVTARYRWQ